MVFGGLIGLGVRAAVAAGAYAATTDRVILVDHDTLTPARQAERRQEADSKRERYEANLHHAMDRIDGESGDRCPSGDHYNEEEQRSLRRRRCCLVTSISLIFLAIIVAVLCAVLIPLFKSLNQPVSTPIMGLPTLHAEVNMDYETADSRHLLDFVNNGSSSTLSYADNHDSPSSLNMAGHQFREAEKFRLRLQDFDVGIMINHPVCCLYNTNTPNDENKPTRVYMSAYRYRESILNSFQQPQCHGKLILYCYPV